MTEHLLLFVCGLPPLLEENASVECRARQQQTGPTNQTSDVTGTLDSRTKLPATAGASDGEPHVPSFYCSER